VLNVVGLGPHLDVEYITGNFLFDLYGLDDGLDDRLWLRRWLWCGATGSQHHREDDQQTQDTQKLP